MKSGLYERDSIMNKQIRCGIWKLYKFSGNAVLKYNGINVKGGMRILII